MTSRSVLGTLCVALLVGAATASAGAYSSSETRVEPGLASGLSSFAAPLPRAQKLPAATPTSYPFDASARSETPLDLSTFGYVEEEYLLEGRANVYDRDAAGRLSVLGNGPYVTRILVRRPAAPKSFNGDVILEPLNPSVMADAPIMWNFSHAQFMREGYIWVGLTFKPVAARALKRFDPVRYARVDLPNPLPSESRCPDPELGPQDSSQELGLAYDIIAQAGALLRSTGSANPLSAYPVQRLYLTGHSQTGGYTRKYANLFSSVITRTGGKHIFDGYVSSGNGPFNPPINGCAPPPVKGDPEMIVAPAGVPVIEIGGEQDTLANYFERRPDSDVAPDLYRRYEVGGASHITRMLLGMAPNHEDFARAGGWSISLKGCEPEALPVTDFPLQFVLDAIWENLDRWVKDGVPPPRASRLDLVPGSDGPVIAKDAHGNARGGVRTTALDVPVVSWYPSRAGTYRCSTLGYSVPFDASVLRALYPQGQDYLKAVEARAAVLRRQRWLTGADAAEVVGDARDFAAQSWRRGSVGPK